MNVNKRLKIAGFFLSLSEWDRHVEVIRQIMNSLEDFEPYAAFLRITKGKQNYIQASNISEFLRENGIRVEERLLGMIVRLYDTSFENRLNFGDFLRMVLTRDNPDMRFESALRPNYDVVGSENKLQEEIEYTLARFFKKASEFLEKLTNDSDTQRLIEERSIFQEVDNTGSKRIDFVNLKAFFETSKIVPRDSEIISILRVIDINDDGIIFEEELDYFVDLFTRRDPSEATLRKLRMIKRTETSITTQNPGLRSKVIKSVVVEEIPSSRFSNYTPKRSDNVARTPPKPSEQATTQFASTLPASRPFMHTNTSDLARTQPVAAREYLYQSRDPQAAEDRKSVV